MHAPHVITSSQPCPLPNTHTAYRPFLPPHAPPLRTLGFFQLEMEGGIFQLAWSAAVSCRGGECSTGTGGEPGPRGTLTCRNLGGSKGSTGMSCILMMRCPEPLAYCGGGEEREGQQDY